LAFTVTDTYLILGSDSTVERVVRTLDSPDTVSISSAKWFTSAKSVIPSAVGLASLQDNATAVESSWRMIKQSGNSKSEGEDRSISIGIGMSPSFGLIFSQMGLDLFNFSLLPEFDAVRKHFGLSASYGISTPDGFLFEFKHLRPPGTD
jgi:hypothetical protein